MLNNVVKLMIVKEVNTTYIYIYIYVVNEQNGLCTHDNCLDYEHVLDGGVSTSLY